MDPRLEGQYSTEGARKAAALAYQCLSSHPKSRPTMRNVVKGLQPLLDLTDIPIGPFVYIAPTQDNKEPTVQKVEEIYEKQLDEVKIEKNGGENKEKEDKSRIPRRKGRKHRRRVKPSRSRAMYSDTDLYKTVGSSLYSLKH